MKFSVITPSFNQALFLEDTIKSVVSQKSDDLEYFIMDGGSTDGSVGIIKKYARLYPRIIKWRSEKDKGQVDAINEGMKKSSGDIIAYINSDDYYLPFAFKAVEDYFISNPKREWVVGDARVLGSNLGWTFWLKHLWPIEKYNRALYMFNTINQPSVFLKKSLVDRVGLFNTSLRAAFDYDYWLRCLRYAKPGRVRQYLSVFRVHPESIGTKSYQDQFAEDYEVVCRYTTDKIALFSHKIGQLLTVNSYKLLKNAKTE
jgi:glycosyltransferase involved in cell wall biosynthesis